jgi:hypothetical protein
MLSQNKVFGADSGQLLEEQSFSNPTPFWVLPAGAGTTLNVGPIPAGDVYLHIGSLRPKSQNEFRTRQSSAAVFPNPQIIPGHVPRFLLAAPRE